MAIYTDGVHLVSDESLDELHTFAIKIGLKRHFFEGTRKNHAHYDLTNAKIRKKAIKNGAKTVSTKAIVIICQMLAKRNLRRNSSFKGEETIKNKKDENS